MSIGYNQKMDTEDRLNMERDIALIMIAGENTVASRSASGKQILMMVLKKFRPDMVNGIKEIEYW